MVALNPQTLKLASHAATTLLRAVPKSQLTRLGLTRAPLLAPLPLAGAALGGAVVAAFVIPQSREWMMNKAKEFKKSTLDAFQASAQESDSTDEKKESASTDAAARVVREVN